MGRVTRRPRLNEVLSESARSPGRRWLLCQVGRGPARGPAAGRARRHASRVPTPATEDRAVEVLILLADRGLHRAPSIPDLIIAATAELAGPTVLHLNKDFEIIAKVTGQLLERLKVI
jgi:predicted nucleic acid-binding protein